MARTDDGDDFLPAVLARGYETFLSGDFRRERQTFCELAAKGQHPHSLVIGCCDSRVMPEEIFGAAPGEIFDLRNIANLVPPWSGPANGGSESTGETQTQLAITPDHPHISVWAAVEYAINSLLVRNIVVLGHSRCGGIRAFVAGVQHKPGALGGWIGLIEPAAAGPGAASLGEDLAEAGGENLAESLARRSVIRSLQNLRSHPDIARLEGEGRLCLQGAFFDIDEARLFALDERKAEFAQVAADRHAGAVKSAQG